MVNSQSKNKRRLTPAFYLPIVSLGNLLDSSPIKTLHPFTLTAKLAHMVKNNGFIQCISQGGVSLAVFRVTRDETVGGFSAGLDVATCGKLVVTDGPIVITLGLAKAVLGSAHDALGFKLGEGREHGFTVVELRPGLIEGVTVKSDVVGIPGLQIVALHHALHVLIKGLDGDDGQVVTRDDIAVVAELFGGEVLRIGYGGGGGVEQLRVRDDVRDEGAESLQDVALAVGDDKTKVEDEAGSDGGLGVNDEVVHGGFPFWVGLN